MLAADSVQGGQYNEIEAHWGTNCRLPGDFDVQVDYQLLEWPAANGVQAGLDSFDATNPIFAIRESQTFGEQYSSWIPQSFDSQPTSDLAGTLRVQREGSTAVVSYLSGATWVTVASAQPRPHRPLSPSAPPAAWTASAPRRSRSPGTTSASTPARSTAKTPGGKTTHPTGKQSAKRGAGGEMERDPGRRAGGS